jgi:hypothetical protein
MGNHKLEHHRSRINTTPPIVLKVAIVETWRQHARIKVIQSLDVGITTTRVETIIAPNIYVVRRGVLIGSVAKLGNELGGVSTKRNLNWNTKLPTTTIGIVGTPQMVFTNLIMTTHVNRNLGWPPMNSMVVGRYKSVNATNLRGIYR